jgi:post-segregation antitoxin (ccd killing protein)
MAIVVSVSVPDELATRWQESDLDISPSRLFQTALETELNKSNQHLTYWSTRALNAEKKLKAIAQLANANDKTVKKFLMMDTLNKDSI